MYFEDLLYFICMAAIAWLLFAIARDGRTYILIDRDCILKKVNKDAEDTN